MAQKCAICGKSTTFGNNISHAHNKTRRTWKPNLIKVRTLVGRSKKTLKICTRCLRSGKAVKV